MTGQAIAEREFIAGRFQLNSYVSIYLKPTGKPTDETFGAEIRLFTRKVSAYVPAWVGRGPVSGREVQLIGGSPFFKAGS